MTSSESDRLLIVDDDLDTLRLYSKLFSDAGYAVQTTSSGEGARVIIQESRPDIVLLDVVLGRESGLEVLESIRGTQDDSYVFVVMITAKAASSDEQASALEQGADGYLIRPIENRELLARISSFMRHKHTIEKLRRSEQQFRRMIENHPDALLVVNGTGQIESANPAAERLFLMSLDELLGKIFGHPVINADFTEIKVVRDGPPTIGEMRTIDIQWNDQIATLTTIRDITKRKEYEAALRDRDERFRLSFQYSHAAMALVSPEGGFREVNDKATELLGYTQEEFQDVGFLDITHPDDTDRAKEKFQSLLAGEYDGYSIDKRYLHKDGHVVHGILTAALVRDADGNPSYVIAQLVDISAQKKAEELERSAQVERDRYIGELRTLARHLQVAREEQSAHVAREIHDDLGQLLTATEMNLARVTRNLENVHDKGVLADIDRSVAEARRNISAAVESTRRLINQLRPAVLDTLGVIGAVEYLVDGMNQDNATSCVLTECPTELDLDEFRGLVVFRFVQEALTNAERHAAAATVEVRVWRDSEVLKAKVTDNGSGFDTTVHASGFGLIGMKERALSCGGDVEIMSSPGAGSSVTLTLPIQYDDPIDA